MQEPIVQIANGRCRPMWNQLIRECVSENISSIFSFLSITVVPFVAFTLVQCDRCRGELTLFIAKVTRDHRDHLRVRVFGEFSARVRSRVIIVISLFATRDEPETIRRMAHRTFFFGIAKETRSETLDDI